MKNYILYNPLSNNNKSWQIIEKINLKGDNEFIDITHIKDIKTYINSLEDAEKIIIAGGDGTLNSFLNSVTELPDKLYFYPCGNGNDFARDVNSIGKLILLKDYIKKLPSCFINGGERIFVNGVGLGIDGYVCSKVNEMRKITGKDANYIAIALKGVLGEYKTADATIWVDGKKHRFSKVWLCSSMKGRFYGGGFMMAPEQDRLDDDGLISLAVVHNASVLKILYAFLLVFKGKHTRLKKSVTIIKGHDIHVEFDKPASLQLDGETYLNIKSFGASSKSVCEVV